MGRRIDRFALKRRLLRPLTALRRRRWSSRCDPFTRAIYESQDYRPAVRRFFRASARDPRLLIGADLPTDAVVLDVGAFSGDWTERILERARSEGLSDLVVHAFEPVPNFADRLERRFGADRRVNIHRYGLGGSDRATQLVVDGPGSSTVTSDVTGAALGRILVEIRDVDAVFGSLQVDRVDLAMINIEGGEFELIDRLHKTGWLGRIECVIVQFHEFAPGAHRRRRRNHRQLSESHTCAWSYPWVYERWDRW